MTDLISRCSFNLSLTVKRDSSHHSCFFSQIPNEHKQRGLQAMGLSVAVVLGFNIGGGNIRHRLGPGQSCVSVQCMKNSSYQLVSIFVKTFVHRMYCTCQLVVLLQYIYIYLLIALSSHCCQVINVFLVTCLAPHCSLSSK